MNSRALWLAFFIIAPGSLIALLLAGLANWAVVSVRTDVLVIAACNLAFWVFVGFVLRNGQVRVSGEPITLGNEPRRFAAYFVVLLLMGLIAAIAAVGIVQAKANRLPNTTNARPEPK